MKYIANCAWLHYELWKTRNFLKNNWWYNIKTIKSWILNEEFKKLIWRNSNFVVEIWILFLADTIWKTDIILRAENDDKIEKYEKVVNEVLKDRNLPPELSKAINQLPINIKLVNEYLLQILY